MLLRVVGIGCYAALGFLLLAFIFSNRDTVTLSLFPLSAAAEMPLYVALCLLFAMGLLIGLMHSVAQWLSMRGRIKRAQRTIAQLEAEIASRPKAPSA